MCNAGEVEEEKKRRFGSNSSSFVDTDEDVPPLLQSLWDARSYLTLPQTKRTAKWYEKKN